MKTTCGCVNAAGFAGTRWPDSGHTSGRITMPEDPRERARYPLTKPCPMCKGAGELIQLEKFGHGTRLVAGVKAFDMIEDRGWTYVGEQACARCRGFGRLNDA